MELFVYIMVLQHNEDMIKPPGNSVPQTLAVKIGTIASYVVQPNYLKGLQLLLQP